jgi:uncharacterized protein (DUF2267 family)
MAIAHNLSRALHVYTDNWIKEMEAKTEIRSEDEAYAGLRAVLKSLRERLPLSEVADLSAQLPLIARGVFLEGWDPATEPKKFHADEFLAEVRRQLGGQCEDIDTRQLTRYVFEVMQGRVSAGEIKDIRSNLPEDISQWLEEAQPRVA